MMILPSVSINLFNSKVDVSPSTARLEQYANEQPTVGAVEKTLIRLGMEKNIFSQESDFIPIVTASNGIPYLQAKSNGSQCVVLGDTEGTPIALIERVDATSFVINSVGGPSGQTPLARIFQTGKVLHVVMEGDSESTYTIHKVISHPSRKFVTKHTIKRNGKPVASTRYGKGNAYLLSVNAGSDVCLMTCLAAIADEVNE